MSQSIKDLCLKIATTYKLDGHQNLEMYFDFIPDDIRSIDELEAFKGYNEFSSSDVKNIVESFALLLGSITTFFTLKQALKKKETNVHSDMIKSSWKNRLLAEGMSADKAEAIVSSFSEDLQKLLGHD
ncbi:hypothetical protein [Fluviicola taffensis]|uniref:hypothetical protein n=1 Tax=Fluviicola taffensis TaxID=191579 RepID=UPI0031379E9C